MEFLIFTELFIYGILIILVTKFLLIWSINKISLLLKLKISTIGQIEGYATSTPELISTIFSAYHGMIDTATYNIMTSNIINVILFLISVIFFNKTKELFKRIYYRYYIIIIISVILPVFILNNNINDNIFLVPLFIFLFILFVVFTKNNYKKNKENIIENTIKFNRYTLNKISRYVFILLLSIASLYILGEKLGNILNSLFSKYGIPQYILGLIIGIITSLPELTTFISSQLEYLNNTKLRNKNFGTIESLNNLLSSNISNILIIQTIGILIFNI